jgi:hypothetical protein
MLNAITSLLTKTVDIFLKINSGENRRRKFSKHIFEVYKALADVGDSLNRIESLLTLSSESKAFSEYDAFSILEKTPLPDCVQVRGYSYGKIVLAMMSLDPLTFGSTTNTVELEPIEALPLFLSEELAFLQNRFATIAWIMEAESGELFQAQHQPHLLRALEIYDAGLVQTFTRAWFLDGGFIEALRGLRVTYEANSTQIHSTDAEFDPNDNRFGYDIKPSSKYFNISNDKERQAFITLLTDCKVAVEKARDSVAKFIAANCKIEDIL